VTTMLSITGGQRAAWQRCAAAALVQILDANRDLPLIVWTIGSAGSTLVGRISVQAPAVQVRAAFNTWRQALTLGERAETPAAAGRRFLRASTVRGAVRVTITATVADDGEQRR
jgi:hypothetical protein